MQTQHRNRSVASEERKSISKFSLVHRTDLVLAAIILAGCGALYYVTTTFEEVSFLLAQNVPPEFFPRLLIWMIVLLALALPFEHNFLKQGRQGLDKARRHRVEPKAFATAGLLTGVVASTPWLGTYLSMVLVCFALPFLWGERRLKILLPFAFIFPTVVTLLFSQVFRVYFDPGIIGPVLH